jgi:hypothetical protein
MGIGGKNRLTHRMVMEALLGRFLRPGEEVHHVDGNRQNNTPENLRVMSKAEHRRIEGAGRPLFGDCQWCGRRFLLRYYYGGKRYAYRKTVVTRFCCLSCAMFYRYRGAAQAHVSGVRGARRRRSRAGCSAA